MTITMATSQQSNNLPASSRWRALGPGIILSAAAVGGSHLVASTQAGALFGWQLWWLILLVNVIKYPFFRFGVTYTLNNQESLIAGYYRKGPWYLRTFILLNLIGAVVNTAGVLLLTASLLKLFLPDSWSLNLISAGLLAICVALLLAGHYRSLDRLAKLIMFSLTVATIVAVAIAWQQDTPPPADFISPSPWELAALGFLVAMMGWMPVPIELSAINSLWIRSKQKLMNLSLRDCLFDFNLGYWVTAVLALLFLALGALIQFGNPQPVAMAGGQFASQFVAMYRDTIGPWSEYLVGAIAFLCMFGTTLAVLDGYARTLRESFRVIGQHGDKPNWQMSEAGWLILQAIAGLALIMFFRGALGPMLTFAMTLAFITTPFFAWLNFSLAHRQPLALKWRVYGWIGVLYLTLFALGFLLWSALLS